MNASALSEVLWEKDQVKEHRGGPGVDPVLQEVCSDGQTPPLEPVGSDVTDEGTFGTFVGGDGI